jgi:crotonobetainyl-CoA:carnitine CoA-transferase CaiB-like acyl-CoA transferase
MQDIAENRHYQERQSILEIDDPLTGKKLKMPNLPFRLLDTPSRIRFPGLPLGAANKVIYRDLLGWSEEKISECKDDGII